MSGLDESNKTYNDDQSAIADVLNGGGVNGALTVGTSSVEAKVGGSALSGRKTIMIQPLDNTVYLGFSSGVTSSNGIRLSSGQIVILPVGDQTAVWLIGSAAGRNVRIAEVA